MKRLESNIKKGSRKLNTIAEMGGWGWGEEFKDKEIFPERDQKNKRKKKTRESVQEVLVKIIRLPRKRTRTSKS